MGGCDVLQEGAGGGSEAQRKHTGGPLVVLLSLRPPEGILLEFTDGKGQGLDAGILPDLHEPDFLWHDRAEICEDLALLQEQRAAIFARCTGWCRHFSGVLPAAPQSPRSAE